MDINDLLEVVVGQVPHLGVGEFRNCIVPKQRDDRHEDDPVNHRALLVLHYEVGDNHEIDKPKREDRALDVVVHARYVVREHLPRIWYNI